MANNADGSVAIEVNMEVSDAEKELAKLKKKIDSTEREIQEIQKSRDQAQEKEVISAAELDREKAKLHEMKQELLEIQCVAKDRSYSPGVREEAQLSAGALRADISEQQERVRMLQTEYNKIASSVERYDERLKSANEYLNEQIENAGELARQIEETPRSIEQMRDATERAQESMKKLNRRISGLMKRAFVFTVITKSLSKLKEWLSKVVKTDKEASKEIAKLKGALLTLAQPLVNVVIPAFTKFVNVLTRVVSAVAGVVSKLFGTTVSKSAEAAESLYKQTEALESTGSAADKAAESLAGFDEINTIQTDVSGGSSSSSSEIVPDFSDFSTEAYKNAINELQVYMEGALLALGAILCLSGANIPLGIALMAGGAIGLAKDLAQDWEAMDKSVKEALTTVLHTLTTLAVVIGAILCMSGANIPLGIALMVGGAGLLGTEIALNWNEMGEELSAALRAILGILGTFSVVIGAILCTSGANIPLGIALMAAGAGMLSVSAAATVNWGILPENIRHVLTTVLAIVGDALLAIGVLLAFACPGALKIGLGLIAAGAVSLGTAVGINWNYIVDAIKENVDKILEIGGAALLAIGLLLACTGVNLPLGIALIAAGAVSLVAAVIIRNGYTTQQVKDFVTDILLIAGTGLLALGLILCLTGVAIPIGVAMIVAGCVGLVTAAALNWGAILENLKEMWRDIKEWWNTSVKKYFTLSYWEELGSTIINGLLQGLKNAWKSVTSWVSEKVSWITNKFSKAKSSASDTSTFSSGQSGGGRVSVQSASISVADIPALASGSVIPRNREFLAVLGDNKRETEIVSPLSTMKQAFLEALQESGGGSQTMEVKLYLDGKQIARNNVKHINDMTMAAGKPVLLF